MSAPCHCLPHPLLTTLRPASRVRVSKGPTGAPLAAGSSRVLQSLPPRESSKKGWRLARISCFKEEEGESSSCNGNSEYVEIRPADEVDEPSTGKKHWFSSIQQIVGRIFILHDEPWTVPWTAETIIQGMQVMLLWIASFWLVGSWIIPFLAHAAGFSKESLTYRGQALYSLLTDVAEGLAGIAILQRCLARFQPLPTGWFHFSLRGTWHLDVGLGCLFFPLVNYLSQINIDLVPLLPSPPVGVSSVEQSIVARDPVAMAVYAVVVAVCAPVWEEIVFRGFLLPSLTSFHHHPPKLQNSIYMHNSMESQSQPLPSNESSSYNDGLRLSFDPQDADSFIEIDPDFFSMRWMADFDSSLPINQAPVQFTTPMTKSMDLGSSDTVSSRCLSLDTSKTLLALSNRYRSISSSRLPFFHRRTPFIAARPSPSRDLKLRLLPSFLSCMRVPLKVLMRYLCSLTPFFKMRLRLAGASRRTDCHMSSTKIEWCHNNRMFDMGSENRIYDAVLHCKNSIGHH